MPLLGDLLANVGFEGRKLVFAVMPTSLEIIVDMGLKGIGIRQLELLVKGGGEISCVYLYGST